jgi:alanine dehydrogenase
MTPVNSDTLVISANDVIRLLDIKSCIDAIANIFCAHEAGGSRGPVSAGLTLPEGSVHTKTAAVDFDGRLFVAVKANVNLPGNPERNGRPTIQGALILLDGGTGQPLAVMDSIALTGIRTAAVAALAAKHLSTETADTITILGCGEQGEAQLRAMSVVRDLRRAFVIDRDTRKAESFASRLADELNLRVEFTTDLTEALRASAVCVTCTTSQTPLLFREHLHPGLFVAAVGADNPAKQEIDAAAMASSRVVVDSLAACAASGDLHHAIEAGRMSEHQVHGELSAIVAGRIPGRVSENDVFIFDSTGTALQDIAAAVVTYNRAVDQGIGLPVLFDDRHATRSRSGAA